MGKILNIMSLARRYHIFFTMKSIRTLASLTCVLVQHSLASPVDSQNPSSLQIGPSIVEVSPKFRNVFPAANFNRNVSVNWWHTDILNGSISSSTNDALNALEDASFIAFDQDFYKVIGAGSYRDNKTVEKIFEFPPGPSYGNRLNHDATVYSPECNCIYFGELHPPKAGFADKTETWIWRTSLNGSKPQTEKVYPKPQLTMLNGAYYHKGSVYFIQEGNTTVPGGVVRMNPTTLETEVVLNNFFGRRFNSPNDIVVTKQGVAYFTDGYYGYDVFNDTLKPQMANGVWRWDINSGDLRQVVGAGTGIFINPNGVALSPGDKRLYVTARGKTSTDFDGQRTIYDFDINDRNSDALPLKYNGIHSYIDAGFPDGVKVDMAGRVYGAVTGGVYVWTGNGRLLGMIKVAEDDAAINMQFVKNWLYIVGRSYVYRVQLAVQGAQTY